MNLAKRSILLVAIFIILPGFTQMDTAIKNCQINAEIIGAISFNISKGGSIKTLPDCYKSNPNFIIQTSLIDPKQFLFANESLRKDELFISRLLKANPEILKYSDESIRSDKLFAEKTTYLNRESLQYVSPKLLDDKGFMSKMIIKDSKNYKFASERLKSDLRIAKIAFEDDGLLIEFAPNSIKSNKSIAKIAVNSNARAINFLSETLRKNPELMRISAHSSSIKSIDKLQDYLLENYVSHENQDRLTEIVNHGKFFKENILVNRNYVIKWRKIFDGSSDKNIHILSSVDNKNHPVNWKEDFKEYPDLTKKIISFFRKRGVDNNTIESLRTTYLWKVKSDLPTMAFNLYLLRNSNDSALGSEYSNVTSITAIAQKQEERWNLTVIEVIFGNEIKVGVNYENGHKKYILWDLYKNDENDQSPKLIFKVEDSFKNHLAIYEETSGGKYQNILDYTPNNNQNAQK